MDEVDVETVDTRQKLWQAIQLRFGFTPVVVSLPVADK